MDKKAHILVVDDEEYICTIVRNMLSDTEGYCVNTCSDPAQALEAIKAERVDLVLTDMVMGKYSGMDIIKACHEHQPDAIVIVMTGHPTVESAVAVMKLGAYDYLLKPFKLEVLRISVSRGLEKLFLQRENVNLKNTISLYQISEAMGSTIHLDSLLKLVLDLVISEFQACLATIELLDTTSGELKLRAFYGDWKDIAEVPLLVGKHSANAGVIESGRPQIVSDLKLEGGCGRGLGNSNEATGVCMPLYVKSKVVGTLNIVRCGTLRPFTTGDLYSLSIIASKAASAIESSMLYDELEKAYVSTITALANAVEARDHYTRGHTERVTKLAEKIAEALGWSDDELKWLKIGATLHDIGKIGVPDSILNKPGPLTSDEVEVMRRHPELGCKMLADVPFLEPILPYVLHHHERWDGTGYPEGLAGTEIPIQGRLLAIADTVDAILSNRPYRPANVPEKAIEELNLYRGIQFDPELADVFITLWEAGRIDLDELYSLEKSPAAIA